MVYNAIMPNLERLRAFTITIKGPLCPLEAEGILFAQAKNGTSIVCVKFDKKGNPIVKNQIPKNIIENDDTGQLGDLHGAMQEANKITISY